MEERSSASVIGPWSLVICWSLRLGHWSFLKLPPLTVLALDKLVGFGETHRVAFRRVVRDLLPRAVGDVAELDGLGQRAGVVEVAQGLPAGLARLGPFPVVADRLGDALFRGLV